MLKSLIVDINERSIEELEKNASKLFESWKLLQNEY